MARFTKKASKGVTYKGREAVAHFLAQHLRWITILAVYPESTRIDAFGGGGGIITARQTGPCSARVLMSQLHVVSDEDPPRVHRTRRLQRGKQFWLLIALLLLGRSLRSSAAVFASPREIAIDQTALNSGGCGGVKCQVALKNFLPSLAPSAIFIILSPLLSSSFVLAGRRNCKYQSCQSSTPPNSDSFAAHFYLPASLGQPIAPILPNGTRFLKQQSFFKAAIFLD